MLLRDFIPDASTGVLLPPGPGREFQYSDGSAAEAALADALASVRDKSVWSQELRACIRDWPSRYYFSPVRSNLLLALSCFNPNQTVLELGAGCGALTRYLGETCRSVDAVEGSRRRAAIARLRCQDLTNVRVFAGDFFDLEFAPHYDIATLIGVLEYAPLFCPEAPDPRQACLTLLRRVAGALRDGVLVLAIENKLGLKYWTGCGEDHTGRLHDGLYGYPGRNPAPVTFSRPELQALLTEAGFGFTAWYYPFPDYKLPNTVLCPGPRAPKDLHLSDWITTPFEDYLAERKFLLQEDLVLKSLCAADLLWDFANSFLVVASPRPAAAAAPAWVAKRFSTGRRIAFATVTTLEDGAEPKVTKTRLQRGQPPEDPEWTFTGDLEMKWYSGELMSSRFAAAIQSPQAWEQLCGCLRTYHGQLLEKFAENDMDPEGYHQLRGEALDCVPGNLIWHAGRWQYIDAEWKARRPFPADYLVFRALHHFVENNMNYLAAAGLLPAETGDLIRALMQTIYPQYDPDRDRRNREREKRFQEWVLGREVNIASVRPLDPLLRVNLELERTQAENAAWRSAVDVERENSARIQGAWEAERRKSAEIQSALAAVLNTRWWRLRGRIVQLGGKFLPAGTRMLGVGKAILDLFRRRAGR
jgi:SAM-dependent methyltransferase